MLLKGGADAFLIGEAFMREADPGAKLKELIG
jgi:indole-3-glycerol phosphate synthase